VDKVSKGGVLMTTRRELLKLASFGVFMPPFIRVLPLLRRG